MRSSILVALVLTPSLACDRAPVEPVAASAAAPPPSAPRAASPPIAAAPADVPPDCAALSLHVTDLIQRTGTAKARAALQPAAKLRGECEARTTAPAMMRCFAAATDAAGLDACNRQAFPGAVDATPVRRFDALADNHAVDPPVLTRDGDYLAWDADCGMLFKEIYPAGALFVACKGRVQIGPLVTIEEVESIAASLSAQESARHDLVMGLVSRAATGDFRVPVHVYADNGAYRGIEYR